MSYLTFNKSKKAQPVCKISGGVYDGQIVYFVSKMDSDLEFEKQQQYVPFLSLKLDKDAKFEPQNNYTIEREIVCCLARSGAGKSYFSNEYIKSYASNNPDNFIFYISPFKNDESLSITNMLYINIDEEYLRNPLILNSFPDDSMLFIDDLDVLDVKKDVKKSIADLELKILNGGRHKNLSLVKTDHATSTQDASIRKLVSESHLIVLYLNTAGNYNTILQKYLGFNTKQIQKLKLMTSRWIAILPLTNIVYTDNEIFFKNTF